MGQNDETSSLRGTTIQSDSLSVCDHVAFQSCETDHLDQLLNTRLIRSGPWRSPPANVDGIHQIAIEAITIAKLCPASSIHSHCALPVVAIIVILRRLVQKVRADPRKSGMQGHACPSPKGASSCTWGRGGRGA